MATGRPTQRMIGAAGLLVALAGCSNLAVDQSTVGSEGAGIAVRRTESAVVVENNTGRPLLDVRATIDTDTGASFIQVLPTLGTGQAATMNFLGFRSEDGTLFELSMSLPTHIKVTAKDSLASQHEATVGW